MGGTNSKFGLWALSLALLTAGCGDGSDEKQASENVGAIGFAIQQVPSDITCIQITGAGSRVQTQSFVVAPLGSTTLVMKGIAPGSVTFSGAAFPNTCASLASASMPTWVADPLTATIVAGTQSNLTLVMRPAGSGGITVDFQGGSGGGVPLAIWDSTNWDNAIWQ